MVAMNPPCALLIDDHAMFRAGLRQVIKVALPDLDIFEAGSLDEAMACPSSNVTVVLLDNKLNGLSGIEGIALIRRKWPLVPILMLSSQFEPEIVRLALARGVDGFLSKAESVETIVQTLQQVMAGGLTCNTTVVPLPQKCLTPRQCAVLDLLHQGHSSRLIARQLFISENTARQHVQSILVRIPAIADSDSILMADTIPR